jgi:hypothetical protein
VAEVAKALGAEWKALTAEEKAPYEERANEDKVLPGWGWGWVAQRV